MKRRQRLSKLAASEMSADQVRLLHDRLTARTGAWLGSRSLRRRRLWFGGQSFAALGDQRYEFAPHLRSGRANHPFGTPINRVQL